MTVQYMTANTARRQAALERFVEYNSKLPTCIRHPTTDEDLIRILGGKWEDLPRQEGESEVMDRGMGYLCQGKRLSKLLTAFEKVTEFQALTERLSMFFNEIKRESSSGVEKACARTTACRWPAGFGRISTTMSLPDPHTVLDAAAASVMKGFAGVLA